MATEDVVVDPPAFTPAPRNRPLQLFFVLIVVLPQLAVWYVSDPKDYEEFWAVVEPAFRLSNWQIWLQEPKFWLVLMCLAFERVVYSVVWLFPSHFCHWAETGPLRRMGEPLDVIVSLFWVSKVFQFGSMSGYYLTSGPLIDLFSLSLVRWVTGIQLFAIGQLLNVSIYRAIGKAGVYYGYKIGVPVPWVTGFPFNVFTMHPQYAGAVMTIFGGFLLTITEEHAKHGFGAVGISGALYYLYMSLIEDMPVEHPLDHTPIRSKEGEAHIRPERRLRDLRDLRWSLHKGPGWDTTENFLGFMTRPWFPMVVAVLAVVDTFLVVLPVDLPFFLMAMQNSYSILPGAYNVAAGTALGVVALMWAWDTGADDNWLTGNTTLTMSTEELQMLFPGASYFVEEYGTLGSLFRFSVQHPAPVLKFALTQDQSRAGLILCSFLGEFIHCCFVGLFANICSKAFHLFYSSCFSTFDHSKGVQGPASSPQRLSRELRALQKDAKKSN